MKVKMIRIVMCVLMIVTSFCIVKSEAAAEILILEHGATSYNISGESIGWYKRGTKVNIIGCDGTRLQTEDDTWIEFKEAMLKKLGTFYLTAYTCSPEENGGSRFTSCGQRLTEVVNWAIAVDKRIIPYYSDVYIDGVGWRKALDCGVAIKGNKIDVLVWTTKGWRNRKAEVWGELMK